jgi:hypothetical protein
VGLLEGVLTNTEIIQLSMQIEILAKRGELLSSDTLSELKNLIS